MRAIQLLLIAASLFVITPFASAQDDDVVIEDLGRLPESFEMTFDSLFNKRYKEYYSLAKPIRTARDNRTLDQLYKQRLYAMESAIPLTYNPAVREAIDLYVNKRSTLLSSMLAKATYYFPIIESALDKNGVPLELKYLAIVESALNPIAVSRQGATGLWQFMLPTGKAYGLHIDSMIDERCDPYKSSEAMAKYMKDMYALYGDWMLAIAAYNCGPGNVNKAIRRFGGSKPDFWKIYQYLPRETRSYVPFFIAAFYSMEHYREHEIRPQAVSVPLATDTIHISHKLSFREISSLSGVSLSIIKDLNPKYRREVVPGNTATQIIRLPSAQAPAFSVAMDTYKPSELPETSYEVVTNQITHTVRRGETIGKIAKRYGVTVADIKSQNKLRSTTLKRGQRIKINIAKEVEVERTPATEPTTVQSAVTTHSVKRGETLTRIAKKYGVSVSDIKKWNNLQSTFLRAGQKLKITSPEVASASLEEPKESSQTTTAAQYHTVKKGETLEKIAKQYGVTLTNLWQWNDLKTTSIKAGQKLNVSGESAEENRPEVASGSTVVPTDTPASKEPTTYTVKKGDNIGKIARAYGTTIDNILEWNRLSSTDIKPGQKLIVSDGTASTQGEKVSTSAKPKVRYHTVKKGDTLDKIAKQYKGTSVAAIRKANGISDNMIRKGQKLKIPY